MKNEKDEITGVSTTGHEWDGIKELDNAPPRWWVIVWIVTIIWAFGYWVLYPAWPSIAGHTKGILGWTEAKQLKEATAEIMAERGKYTAELHNKSVEEILKDPKLADFAAAAGKVAFKNNCAMCHGSGAQGAIGFPNLNDDNWLWGGKITDIYQTIKYGIRSGNPNARESQMPAFGKDGILTAEEINTVAEYVLSWSNNSYKPSPEGAKIFAANCAVCHGEGGEGKQEVGAPRLNSSLWLYGGDIDTVIYTITYARSGVMPAFVGRLDDDTIKELAIYIHSLGGGL